jgi:hypothetical protein
MGKTMTPWEIEADQFVTCNCDYGCPCQFNALPTHGDCQAVHGYIIGSGRYGDVSLDGLKAAIVLRWPGPIHEGNGERFIVIDERADEAQRQALLTILGGEETDPFATVWNVFASTTATLHDPEFHDLDVGIDVEERTGHVRIDGRVETTGEPIRNPVSGEPHRVRIDLVGGFEYELAEMGSGTARTQGPIDLSWDDAYAQFAHLHLNNHGIVPRQAT